MEERSKTMIFDELFEQIELSNNQSLWNKSVCDCCIKGLFRKKIQIIIKDGNIDT